MEVLILYMILTVDNNVDRFFYNTAVYTK